MNDRKEQASVQYFCGGQGELQEVTSSVMTSFDCGTQSDGFLRKKQWPI